MSVAGWVDAQELGPTLPHEHVMVDFIGAEQVSLNRYDRDEVFGVVLPHLKHARQAGCRTLAILLVHEGRMKHGRRIPVVQKAAGLTNDLPELYRRPQPPQFDPTQALRPLWQALVKGEDIRMGRYDDGLAWTYREECARAALSK